MYKILNVLYIFILLLFIYVFQNKKSKFGAKIIISLFFFYFYIKELGLDYEPYKNWYYALNFTNLNALKTQHIEPLVAGIIYTLKYFEQSHHVFFLIMGGLPLYLNYKIIKKECNMVYLGLFTMMFMYFFIGYSDAMRQLISATIYLYILKCIVHKNKKIRAIILLFISIGFHYSSIVITSLIFVLKINWNLKKYLYSITIALILGLIFKNVVLESLKDIEYNSKIFFKFKYYIVYHNDRYLYQNNVHKILWYINTILYPLGTIFINISVLNKKIINSEFKIMILKSSILGSLIFLFLLGCNLSIIGFRLSLTLCFGSYFLLEELFYKKKAICLKAYFILMNICIFLYYIGIHDEKSIFYIL